ncbi:MAG: ABC transporter permease [Myxococcales bacterium]|nr:ABC transporter permease [Myxococcales bacterium]
MSAVRQRVDLLWFLTKKEIILKYKRAYLGFFWSLLNPLLTAVVLFVAFKIFMRIKMENYTLFLLTALFPWTWFSASVLLSAGSLTGNIHLIKKVLFPRHFIIIAVIGSQMINLLLSIPILAIFVFHSGSSPGLSWLVGIPLLTIVQFAVTLGLSLVCAMLNAYFGDMEYLVSIAVSLLFWMTPIIYPIEQIPEDYRIYMTLNPLTYLISAWRELILRNSIEWTYVLISTATAAVVLAFGAFVFHRMGSRLDEVL